MTKVKLAVASTITAAMILGSTLVFASTPADSDAGTSAGQQTVTTEQPLVPMRKGGGGGAIHLKK